ncbi:MAG: RIP metalloprotease RseP [bacterium]
MSIIIMVLLISVLIIIHELGHFLAAKSIGINPERFGLGLPLGPTLYEKKFGETIFCIHAFLLGGYVSFPEDNPENDTPLDNPNRLDNKTILQRAWVVSAGVLANAIFAFILVLFVAFASGGLPVDKYNISIDDLYTQTSTAAKDAGILPKDKIYQVEGIKITNPSVFMAFLQENKEANAKISQEKINATLKQIYKLNPNLRQLKENNAIAKNTKIILPKKTLEKPMISDTLSKLHQGKADKKIYSLTSEEQKLRDEIYKKSNYKTDGKTTLSSLAAAVGDYKQPISITVLRNNKEITLSNISPSKEGVIGIKLFIEEIAEPTNSIKDGFVNSWNYLSINTIMMIKGLGSIFTGKVPIGELHGIIAIAKVGGDIIQYQGIWKGFLLTAIISMNLAIINFLPIPALDGGYIFFLIIEAITGKKVNPEAQEQIMKYSFLALILLMFFVIFNDIFALVTNKF